MEQFITEHYLWIKAFHLIAVISWMAGLLYLPRLFVYHTNVKIKSEASQTFKIMERKLLRVIMNPAMIVAWILGGLMLWVSDGLMQQGWMHVKLTAVLLITGYHHVLIKWWKEFERDERKHSEKFFRIANEIPALLLVVIVIMVIVQPF